MKIVCGGTTAIITARILNKNLESNNNYNSVVSPPGYKIEGINLVTEGIVTLNQVYNLLDEDSLEQDDESPVFELLDILLMADRVNIFTGKSNNSVGENIVFKQQGILSRKVILQLIREKLIEKGKLVVNYDY